MFNVTVRGPDGSETSYPLGPDQGLIVGRDPECDIVLASKRISRRHARFFTADNKLQVEDLGSQNGVFVGGARISGTVEIRPGPPIEIGEFSLRIRREDLNSAENSYAGMLQGFGSMEGSTLTLPKERGVVGRDGSADIVVHSDSVSRRHAELRYAGIQGFYVQDLGSANGTYVNGVRLQSKVERPLRPGDRIQFGDAGWIVVPKSALAPPVSDKSRRRVLLVLLGSMVLLTAGVVFFLQHPIGLSGNTGSTQNAPHIQAPAIDLCNQAIQDQKWEDAQRYCAQAYEEEPFLDRRELLRKSQRELVSKQIYDDAVQKASVGSDREAVERFFDLDPNSSYFPQARIQAQQIAKGLMRTDDNACLDAGRKRKNDKALEACAHYLRYQCHNGVDEEALKILRNAEKDRSGAPWQCPASLAVWFKSGLSGPADRDTYCKPKYTDKTLCDAIVRYAHQQSGDAERLLSKVKQKDTEVNLDTLRQAITAVDGQYKAGQSALTANDFTTAEKDFKSALASDATIMQKNVESDYAKAMRDKLAGHYQEAGAQAQAREHYNDAFRSYSAGVEYRTALNHNLDDLENVAAGMLTHSRTCDTAHAVLNYTRDNSPTHVEAAKFIAMNHCP